MDDKATEEEVVAPPPEGWRSKLTEALLALRDVLDMEDVPQTVWGAVEEAVEDCIEPALKEFDMEEEA